MDYEHGGRTAIVMVLGLKAVVVTKEGNKKKGLRERHRRLFMITLSIDTTEARGSIAVRRDGQTVAVRLHEGTADYSSWILRAADDALQEAMATMESVDLLAVATGPGSFTGVRVGLTSVKAWAEVYGKPLVGVSRLESMARVGERAGLVAASYDAQRGQIFGALYHWVDGVARAVDAEMVIAPEAFVAFVEENAAREPVQWVTLDPQVIRSVAGWGAPKRRGDRLIVAPADVASLVGELAEERARSGEFTDVLELDANYVRRSDAEIFWKGPASGVC